MRKFASWDLCGVSRITGIRTTTLSTIMAKSIHDKLKKTKNPRVHIEYDVEVKDEMIKHLAKAQLLYSFVGLVLGIFVMVLGCILLYLGITGETKFVAETIGIKAELSDAAPGTLLIVVGLVVVVVTKFKFTIRKKSGIANKVG